MDKVTAARELAEEIRTNSKLRHRLGMEQGSQMASAEDSNTVIFGTASGETFHIKVEQA